MAKAPKKKAPKKSVPKKYAKPLSLSGISFVDAVDTLLATKPTKGKTAKKKK
jgi:hypothetical protein